MNSFVPADMVRTCCSIDPLRSCTKTTRTFLRALTLASGRSSSTEEVGAEAGETGLAEYALGQASSAYWSLSLTGHLEYTLSSS